MTQSREFFDYEEESKLVHLTNQTMDSKKTKHIVV